MKDIITIFDDIFGGKSYKTNKKSAANYAKSRTFGGLSNRLFESGEEQKKRRSVFFLIIVGVFGIAAGCLILIFNPYDLIFRFKIVLSDGGEIFQLWKTPPVELYLKVYLFNVTNREDFLSGKDRKLRVQEVGPYVYREFMEHSNVTFNGNGTMTAIPAHPLKWVPEMSNGTEEDLLILPNIALLSMANVVTNSFSMTRMAANLLIHTTDSHPLVQMTAREFMFGYQTNLVTLGNTFIPSWIKFDKLGLIDRMYDFDGDVATYYTGEDDLSKSGMISTYNGAPKLPQWKSPCGWVNDSSDGTKFPSLIKPNDTIMFYRKSLCRAVPIVRVGNETYRSGLRGFEYHFVENSFDNGFFNEENKCFCRNNRCLPRGLLDVTDCYYGFPIALSFPHYFQTDPKVLDRVEGVNPDPAKHQTYFIVEPDTGLPLEVSVRMQINMAFDNIARVSRVEKFANMILPLLWTDITMKGLPPKLASLFEMYINIFPLLQEIAIYLLFTGGAAFVLIAIIKLLRTSPEKELENFHRKYAHEKTPIDTFEMEKKTKSPVFNSKDVISDIIDEGKQRIFGKKQNKAKYESVYKDTVRRRSSLSNVFSFITRREGVGKSKTQQYDLKKSQENARDSMPLRPSTDSETDSDKSKSGDPFMGEENLNFSETEETLKKTLQRQNSLSDSRDFPDDFEIDVSMLDSIKEERI